MKNLIYRKAKKSDVESMAILVTKNLGTSNINNTTKKTMDTIEIIKDNKVEIEKEFENYYVCEADHEIVGICGISSVRGGNVYHLNLGTYREILYLVVEKEYQKKGIGTKLMHLCCDNNTEKIVYEAWGDQDYVNSKFLLQKLSFHLFKDLGNTYYKDHGYCPYCVNRNQNCNRCKAEIWVKDGNEKD